MHSLCFDVRRPFECILPPFLDAHTHPHIFLQESLQKVPLLGLQPTDTGRTFFLCLKLYLIDSLSLFGRKSLHPPPPLHAIPKKSCFLPISWPYPMVKITHARTHERTENPFGLPPFRCKLQNCKLRRMAPLATL